MNGWIWGALAAAGFAAAGYINYRRFVPKPKALGSNKYSIETKDLTVDAENYTLFGQLLTPRGIPGKLPTVIVSHGLNSNGRNTKAMVGESLAMSGFQVYCYDFRGGSLHSASGGRMEEMTVFSEKADLNAVIEKIKTLETTDTENLFLLGESQGGFVTGITAAEHPEIKAVINTVSYCIIRCINHIVYTSVIQRYTNCRNTLAFFYRLTISGYRNTFKTPDVTLSDIRLKNCGKECIEILSASACKYITERFCWVISVWWSISVGKSDFRKIKVIKHCKAQMPILLCDRNIIYLLNIKIHPELACLRIYGT